jgi:muramoyltetrapeptide carboxypeptidase LdcA involved in peptidoglycan recycling
VDEVHARSLRAALVTGERIEITEPGESEDFGVDWADPRALDFFGEREPAGAWSWHGPARTVTGRAWGGCVEVIEETFIAGVPFGHTRPQWILPHSGTITVDGTARRVTADYS